MENVNEFIFFINVRIMNKIACALGILITIVIVLMITFLVVPCKVTTPFKNVENFSKEERKPVKVEVKYYNPLYVSPDPMSQGSYVYTQPPGDRRSMKYANTGQGTSGTFFPLQGAVQPFLMESDEDNNELPTGNPGKIGGYPNYTSKLYDSSFVGFNDFGYPFSDRKGPKLGDSDYSNSYLIEGANERVRNPGQLRTGNVDIPCSTWWPSSEGATCSSETDMYHTCISGNEKECKAFLNSKNTPEWKKLRNTVEKNIAKI